MELRGKLRSPIDFRMFAIVTLFSRTSIVNILSVSGIEKPLLALVVTGFAYLFLVFSMIFYKKTILWDGVLLIVFSVLFFYISIKKNTFYHSIYFDGEFEVFSRVFNLYSMVFSYYFVRILPDFDKLRKAFKYIAIVTFLGMFWNFSGVSEQGAMSYSMIYGYSMSLCAILFLWIFLESNKKYLYLMASFLSILLSVLLGSRGGLLGYLVYIILYFTLIDKPVFSLKKIFFLLISILGGLLYKSQGFLMYIYRFMANMGFESRTLLTLAQGNITAGNGRDRIYLAMTNKIENMSIFEFGGAYGDRIVMNGRFYAHNIVYEVIITFGKFFGILILSFILYLFTRALYLTRKNKSIQNLLLAIISFSISRLWISNSFWYEQFFGVAVGLAITIIKNNHEMKTREA